MTIAVASKYTRGSAPVPGVLISSKPWVSPGSVIRGRFSHTSHSPMAGFVYFIHKPCQAKVFPLLLCWAAFRKCPNAEESRNLL